MSASEQTIALLTAIAASLKSIDANIKKLVTKEQGAAVASDKDLDGKYGDPVVKFDPRDWTGESCKGLPMSQCPAPFLDLLAETFDYFAGVAEEKNEQTDKGKPTAQYKRADAARARGWAKRIREGKVSQTSRDDAGFSKGGDW